MIAINSSFIDYWSSSQSWYRLQCVVLHVSVARKQPHSRGWSVCKEELWSVLVLEFNGVMREVGSTRARHGRTRWTLMIRPQTGAGSTRPLTVFPWFPVSHSLGGWSQGWNRSQSAPEPERQHSVETETPEERVIIDGRQRLVYAFILVVYLWMNTLDFRFGAVEVLQDSFNLWKLQTHKDYNIYFNYIWSFMI